MLLPHAFVRGLREVAAPCHDISRLLHPIKSMAVFVYNWNIGQV
jgi:hypothetical protein